MCTEGQLQPNVYYLIYVSLLNFAGVIQLSSKKRIECCDVLHKVGIKKENLTYVPAHYNYIKMKSQNYIVLWSATCVDSTGWAVDSSVTNTILLYLYTCNTVL